MNTAAQEHARLREARDQGVPWRRWGPYLSERQWGIVREDYSTDGNAWDYFGATRACCGASRSTPTTSTTGSASTAWRPPPAPPRPSATASGSTWCTRTSSPCHQTGWTGVVSTLINIFGGSTARGVLEGTVLDQRSGAAR
jgi:hypothetical protein